MAKHRHNAARRQVAMGCFIWLVSYAPSPLERSAENWPTMRRRTFLFLTPIAVPVNASITATAPRTTLASNASDEAFADGGSTGAGTGTSPGRVTVTFGTGSGPSGDDGLRVHISGTLNTAISAAAA